MSKNEILEQIAKIDKNLNGGQLDSEQVAFVTKKKAKLQAQLATLEADEATQGENFDDLSGSELDKIRASKKAIWEKNGNDPTNFSEKDKKGLENLQKQEDEITNLRYDSVKDLPKEAKPKTPKAPKKKVQTDDADCYAEIDRLNAVIEDMQAEKTKPKAPKKPAVKRKPEVAVTEDISKAVNTITKKTFAKIQEQDKNPEKTLKRISTPYAISAKNAEGKEVKLNVDFVGLIGLLDNILYKMKFGFADAQVEDENIKTVRDFIAQKVDEIKEKITEQESKKQESKEK